LKRSNRLMLVFGVLLAIVAFGGVLLFGSGSGDSTPPPPDTAAVVTAAVDVPLGTALDASMLTTVQKPLDETTDTYSDPTDLIGHVVRQTVRQGQTFTSAVFDAGTGLNAPDVTSNLAPGQVAMAINVDPVAGVGSLIQTGDHVDVVLALYDSDGKNPVVYPSKGDPELQRALMDDSMLNNTTVKVLVQNVQVLGTLRAPTPDGSDTSTLTDMTVILSVTPQQAEMVRFTQADGNLSLLLRSPEDADAPDAVTTGITLRTLVDTYGVLPPQMVTTTVP
jgi:Flp pilus assembly protein CpaB